MRAFEDECRPSWNPTLDARRAGPFAFESALASASRAFSAITIDWQRSRVLVRIERGYRYCDTALGTDGTVLVRYVERCVRVF